MRNLTKLFQQRNIFENKLTSEVLSSHRSIPHKFIALLLTHPQHFTNYIDSPTPANLSPLQKTTLVHLLHMHTPQFQSNFQKLQLDLITGDPWMDRNVLLPYQNFIRKVLNSSQHFDKVRIINNGWNNSGSPDNVHESKMAIRDRPKQFFNLQMMYYIINLLGELFRILKHVSNLGRYYLRSQADTIIPFVKIASHQAVQLYFAFKFMINEMIFRYRFYLQTQAEDLAFRDILLVDLDKINDQMKNVILNKYFDLLGAGIKTNLFELDRQSEENRALLDNIFGEGKYTQPDHDKIFKKNRKFLGKSIFKDGGFDQNLFQESVILIDSQIINHKNLQDIYDQQQGSILNIRETNGSNGDIQSLYGKASSLAETVEDCQPYIS